MAQPSGIDLDTAINLPRADPWPWRLSVDLSVWTGVKLGAGFAIGVALVTIISWMIVILLLGVGIRSLSR